MPADQHEPRIDQARSLAQLACVCMAVALLMWAIAPTIIARLVSNQPPHAATYVVSAAFMLLGLTFGALSFLIARGVPWAAWVTLGFSVALLLGALGLVLTRQAGPLTAIVALLPMSAAGTSWLVIDARRRTARAHGQI